LTEQNAIGSHDAFNTRHLLLITDILIWYDKKCENTRKKQQQVDILKNASQEAEKCTNNETN
jgi:hypothetical protein